MVKCAFLTQLLPHKKSNDSYINLVNCEPFGRSKRLIYKVNENRER